MGDSSKTTVLAIDGGGTRCRIALDDGQTVTTVEAGSANVSTDFDGSVREILGGLERLVQQTGRADLANLPAFVGLAGVSGPEIADRLRNALPFRTLRIEDDRPAALRGALGDRDGVIAHCGTGSFFAAQSGGRMRFAGGWGHVLGDEASAQWIGKAALRVTLETTDGLYERTQMADRLLADLGGTPGIVKFAGSARPPEFGALARLVTEHADKGDTLAQHVLRLGADHIARIVPQLGWRPGTAVCLTGGIGPQFGPYLPATMQASLTARQGEPLDGALALAREIAR